MSITPSETGAVVGGVCTRQDLHCATAPRSWTGTGHDIGPEAFSTTRAD